jgi:hypothetical protein
MKLKHIHAWRFNAASNGVYMYACDCSATLAYVRGCTTALVTVRDRLRCVFVTQEQARTLACSLQHHTVMPVIRLRDYDAVMINRALRAIHAKDYALARRALARL